MKQQIKAGNTLTEFFENPIPALRSKALRNFLLGIAALVIAAGTGCQAVSVNPKTAAECNYGNGSDTILYATDSAGQPIGIQPYIDLGLMTIGIRPLMPNPAEPCSNQVVPQNTTMIKNPTNILITSSGLTMAAIQKSNLLPGTKICTSATKNGKLEGKPVCVSVP